MGKSRAQLGWALKGIQVAENLEMLVSFEIHMEVTK
jgi:hypothetical protein